VLLTYKYLVITKVIKYVLSFKFSDILDDIAVLMVSKLQHSIDTITLAM